MANRYEPEVSLKECYDCDFVSTYSWEFAEHLSLTGHKRPSMVKMLLRGLNEVFTAGREVFAGGRIKARGVRTVGRVLGMRSESGTTYTYSSLQPGSTIPTSYTIHTMSYEFNVKGRRYGAFHKKVTGSLANKEAGDQITVYYLPKAPHEHTIE